MKTITKTITYYEIGDKVRVTKSGNNASQFGLKRRNISFKGVYSLHNWQDIIFTVSGDYEYYHYDFSPETYGAYPLTYEGKLVGYVYNDALEIVK